jgi:ubiquinone/menaquinone biosynthesis C-methylase UbiE
VNTQRFGNAYGKEVPRDPISRLVLKNFVTCVCGLVEKLPARSILDVGCGEGWLTSHLIKVQPSTTTIYALDVSMALLGRVTGFPSSAKRVVAAAEFLPFHDDSFDVVVASEVLEHLQHPEAALREINRVTMQHALITVPHEPFWSLGNVVFGRHLRNLGNTPGHLHRWSRRSFLALLDTYLVRVSSRIAFPWIVVLARKRRRTDR